MNKVENIREFLKDWKNENTSTQNSYLRYKEWVNPDGNIEELDFFEELENKLTILGVKYCYTCVGLFDSPGYDATYDCLVVINEQGEMDSFPIITEIY